MTPKPSIFIGSSKEGRPTAKAIEAILKNDAKTEFWENHVFGLNQGTLESLIDAADKCDFAILVLTSDDVTESRDERMKSPRDNILFEAGLFMGSLGKERAFIIYPNNVEMKLPSDLLGLKVATYDDPADKNDLRSAVSAGCTDIIETVNKLGKKGKVISIGNNELTDTLSELFSNITKGLSNDQEEFRQELASHCQEWHNTSKDWPQGKIIVRQNYEDLLKTLYRSAKTSIVSTSVPGYQKTWTSDLGKSLIKIQKANDKAKSTRIFIFNEREDITNDDHEVFEEQFKANIEVRILYNRATSTFPFPADVGNDWTIVDGGSAIGITRHMDEHYEAQWFFGDKQQANRFANFQKKLMEDSIPLEEFKKQ